MPNGHDAAALFEAPISTHGEIKGSRRLSAHLQAVWGTNVQEELISTLVLLTHGGECLSSTCSFQTIGLKWEQQVIN